MRIYVGNLPYDVSEEDLTRQFAAFGQVESIHIPRDESGRSKGFGFVEMPAKSEAEAAIAGINGKTMNNRTLTVNEARPRESGTRGFGGGGPPRR